MGGRGKSGKPRRRKLGLLRAARALRASFWFLPSVMAAACALLAFLTLWLDGRLDAEAWPEALGWLQFGGTEGARALLAALAGSMVTVTSVVFSITMVVLVQASQQFGPRLLSSFMRDRGNQLVLGTFTATFLYCLMVLAAVGAGEEGFLPRVSVLAAMLLGVGSVGVLLYFIHHVASKIQVDVLVADVGAEMDAIVDRIWPDDVRAEVSEDPGAGPGAALAPLRGEVHRLCAEGLGYVQTVDRDRLLELAIAGGLTLEILVRPGHHRRPGEGLLAVHPAHGLDAALLDDLRACFLIGRVRTPEDDLEFSFLQLVEIAVRALSPGINDPFTAVVCIDRIGSGLARLAARPAPAAVLRDAGGTVRLITRGADFAGVAAAACNQIRQNAAHHVSVRVRLLEMLTSVLEAARRESDAAALAAQAEALWRETRARVDEPRDLEDIRGRMGAFRALLEARFPGRSPPGAEGR